LVLHHANGWNPRPVEGFDHIFFYALEHRTGLHFIHGYPVLLGVSWRIVSKQRRVRNVYDDGSSNNENSVGNDDNVCISATTFTKEAVTTPQQSCATFVKRTWTSDQTLRR
jgi:hypothetical protein